MIDLGRFALVYVQFTLIRIQNDQIHVKKQGASFFQKKIPAGRYTTSHRASNLRKSFNLRRNLRKYCLRKLRTFMQIDFPYRRKLRKLM